MKSGAGVPLTGSLRTFVCGAGRVYIPQYFFVTSGRGFDSASGGYFFVGVWVYGLFVFCLFLGTEGSGKGRFLGAAPPGHKTRLQRLLSGL